MNDPLERKHLDPAAKHKPLRNKLRVIGPIVFLTGLGLLGWGLYDVFLNDNLGFHFSPFVGMLLMFIGASMSMMGYAGAMARYHANEVLPVAKDGVNYMAEGTQDGVRTATRALAEGLREGLAGQPLVDLGRSGALLHCHQCNALNQLGSKFCDQCGVELTKTKPCPTCAELNDGNANYCDHCGHELA